MKYKLLLIAIIFCSIHMLSAQDDVLSKEEAVALALDHNFGIKIAKNRVAISKNNSGILNSGYLPSLTGNAGATYSNTDSKTSFPEDDTPTTDINDAESRLYSGSLQVNYTLFDGLGRYYNYKSLKEQYQLSELQARETIENTMIQLFSVYFEVARLTENKRVLSQALRISLDRITRANYAFEYGQNTKLDVLNAQVDVTNDSIIYMNNHQRLENAKRDLNVVLNQELSKLYTVDTTVNFIPISEIEGYIDTAKDNNVTILQNKHSLAINAYDVKVSRSGYLPTVGLRSSYGWNLNTSAKTAVFPAQKREGKELSVGANLTWNLFDGGRTSTRIRNAKIVYLNQELIQKQQLLEIERDFRNAFEIYKNRLQVFNIQQQNVITNQHNFKRSTNQFQIGRITSLQFRQAQINLLNAQTQKNAAKYDAKLAELQLLQLLGQLLNVQL